MGAVIPLIGRNVFLVAGNGQGNAPPTEGIEGTNQGEGMTGGEKFVGRIGHGIYDSCLVLKVLRKKCQ
jgi:hypothetical protein